MHGPSQFSPRPGQRFVSFLTRMISGRRLPVTPLGTHWPDGGMANGFDECGKSFPYLFRLSALVASIGKGVFVSPRIANTTSAL